LVLDVSLEIEIATLAFSKLATIKECVPVFAGITYRKLG
jgi:hypothetical protein